MDPSPAPRPSVRGVRLKMVLIAGDAAAVGVGFAAALTLTPRGERQALTGRLEVTIIAVVLGVWAMHAQGLHLARVSAVRLIELSRTVRAVVVLTVTMLIADRVVHLGLRVRELVPSSVAALGLLCVWRSIFRSSLARSRRHGRRLRRVVVIGAGEEAARLTQLCMMHPEVGFEVVGVIGGSGEAAQNGLLDWWLGEVDDAESVLVGADTSGVFVTPGSTSPQRQKELLHHAYAHGLHVHLTTGLCGLDSRRIRLLPLAHEPLFYLEPPNLAPGRVLAKRCFDVVVAAAMLVVMAPSMLLIGVAIRLVDGGPAFVVQQRVGRDGRQFGLAKFRTMSVGGRRRVTRLGRFLREVGLDELPQMLDVVRGRMSLVGPRPALPSEAAVLDLISRERIVPGLTGLWRVEARDNPSFAAYRRLDRFYVENWSATLDLVIIVATVEHLVGRWLRMVVRRVTWGRRATSPVPAR